MEASIFSIAAFSSAVLPVIWDGVSEVTPSSAVAVVLVLVVFVVGVTRGRMRITPDVALSLLSFVKVLDVDVASSLSLSSRSVGSTNKEKYVQRDGELTK